MKGQRWKAAGRPAVTMALYFLAAGGAALTPRRVRAETLTPVAPETREIPPAALERLAEDVRRLVTEDRVVGAEVVVIHHRRLVFHRAFGWMDREAGIPMKANGVYNLRSMTKPLTGVAAQMLIDEGRLAEPDPVWKHIPSFRAGPGAGITVGHLLTHRSGLPMSVVTDVQNLASLGSLAALAERAASTPLSFSPGSSFGYSDTGTDVLGRVVEAAAGVALDQFVARRILEPLGMTSTFYYIRETDSRSGGVCSAYGGAQGGWMKYWTSGDPPIYRFAMGSQSLYGTAPDYARFLMLLLDGGRAGGRALLSPAAVARILTPISPMPLNQGLRDVEGYYGQMMMLGVEKSRQGAPPPRVVCFGHGGSDGTMAWAWPERDLIVLFFTQSRGHTADVLFDLSVQASLLDRAENAGLAPALRPLVGEYVDIHGPSGLSEISIRDSAERLCLEIPGQGLVPLEPPDAEGRFRISVSRSGTFVTFERDAAGSVAGMKWHEGGKVLDLPRSGTPAAEALVRQVLARREPWRKYLGFYHTEEAGKDVEVTMRDGCLALLPPGTSMVLHLNPPDASGRWAFRVNPAAGVMFQENESGEVVSFTSQLPDGRRLLRPRAAGR